MLQLFINMQSSGHHVIYDTMYVID